MEDTTTETPIVHSNQATATIYGWGKGDWNVSLDSLESSFDVLRGGIRQSGNGTIGMNPPVTIGGNGLQGTGRRGYDKFVSARKYLISPIGAQRGMVKQ